MNDEVKQKMHAVRRWASPVLLSAVTLWVGTAGKAAVAKIDEMHTFYLAAKRELPKLEQIEAVVVEHENILSEGGRYTQEEGTIHESRTLVLEERFADFRARLERIERKLDEVLSR